MIFTPNIYFYTCFFLIIIFIYQYNNTMTSHYNSKIENRDSFYNFETRSEFERQIVKKSGRMFNYPVHQLAGLTQNRLEQFVIARDNQVPLNPCNTGAYADFKLQRSDNHVLDSVVLRHRTKNSSGTNISLNNGPLLIDHVDVLSQNNALCPSITGESIMLLNMIPLNDEDTQVYKALGFNSTFPFFRDYLVNDEFEYFTQLPLPISNINFYMSKVSHDVTIRVYFRKDVTFNTQDAGIDFNDIELIVNATEVTNNEKMMLQKQYSVKENTITILPMHNKYSIPGIIINQDVTVQLTSYENAAIGMFIWLTYQQVFQTDNKYFADIKLDDIQLLSNTNESMLNGVIYKREFLEYQAVKHFFPKSKFFTNTKNRVVFLPFCSNPAQALESGVLSGSMVFKDSKLKFKPSTTANVPFYVNVVFLTVAMAEIAKNQLTIQLS